MDYLSRNCNHNVFPSFHGADVRKNILSHILASFRRKGINPFIDEDIIRSKSIGPELIEAIRVSKIAIVLLSKNYASSSWCLDELAEIINCREVLNQIVIPIFYEVDPCDIKKQTENFGEAFTKTCEGKSKEQIEGWKKALKDVATIAGEHSSNWSNEAAMIEKISTDVSNMLTTSMPSRDFDDYVGMRAHTERMESLLCLDLDEVRMIGIWGPPGVGKSTIARVVFNQHSSRFQHGTMMVNIKGCYPRPCLDEYNAQLQLQNQMLSQIIDHKDIKISHLGVAQELLKDKKVLLVVDEVDSLGQLHALAKEISWFGFGSRIIITTEDRSILNAHGINHIYKVKFPSSGEAFEIFCMYAFGQKHPYDGFYELAIKVSFLAGQLPLGLKVLGSALRGKSKQEWKMMLPRLKTSLDGEIESIIKFSYNTLLDEDKYLFLYIACFFNHHLAHKVEELLAKKFSNVRQGIHTLAQKSLINIQYGRIEMHILLVKFGRETSRYQFVHHGLAKRQFLVDERDISEVLSDDTTDNNRVIAIDVKLSKWTEEEWTEEEMNISASDKALKRMTDLQFVRVHDFLLPHSVLQMLICHSPKIRLLTWKNFGNICLPSTFNPKFLVELVMEKSKLQKLWDGNKNLENLKCMDLSYSRDLKELPNLSTAIKLEELILSVCSSLVELPDLSTATQLTKLILDDCSKLVKLPISIGKLTNLRVLNLQRCKSLVNLPSSIENATNLQRIDLYYCTNLVEIPTLGNEMKLRQLDLRYCKSLAKLPSFIDATNLQELSLRGRIVELPALRNATNLLELDICGCSSVLELPPSFVTATNLQKLDICRCSSLVKLPSSIGDLTNLKEFNLCRCSNLVDIPTSIGTATNLESLDISGCSSLVKLPSSIGDLVNLKEFFLSKCSSLVELPSSIGNLQKLQKLIMYRCSKLEALPTNINLESLDILDLDYCSQLQSFPQISTNIEELNLKGTAINEIPFTIMLWPRLWHLVLKDCNNLVFLPRFPDSLSYLDASNCKSLERLYCSFNNPNIFLEFTNCFKLNLEARDIIIHTSTCNYAVLPGTEMPACFKIRATAGGLLTMKLNESPLPTYLRLKACIMLFDDDGDEETSDDELTRYLRIYMMKKQNDRMIPCRSIKREMSECLTEHIYIFEFAIKVGAEEVISTELVFEFKICCWELKIREFGLMQI